MSDNVSLYECKGQNGTQRIIQTHIDIHIKEVYLTKCMLSKKTKLYIWLAYHRVRNSEKFLSLSCVKGLSRHTKIP